MEQNNKTNVWKIVLISLAVAAVAAVGVFFLIKFLKKRKALKEMVIEWDDEDEFEKCINGHGNCDIVVLSDAE